MSKLTTKLKAIDRAIDPGQSEQVVNRRVQFDQPTVHGAAKDLGVGPARGQAEVLTNLQEKLDNCTAYMRLHESQNVPAEYAKRHSQCAAAIAAGQCPAGVTLQQVRDEYLAAHNTAYEAAMPLAEQSVAIVKQIYLDLADAIEKKAAKLVQGQQHPIMRLLASGRGEDIANAYKEQAKHIRNFGNKLHATAYWDARKALAFVGIEL